MDLQTFAPYHFIRSAYPFLQFNQNLNFLQEDYFMVHLVENSADPDRTVCMAQVVLNQHQLKIICSLFLQRGTCIIDIYGSIDELTITLIWQF